MAGVHRLTDTKIRGGLRAGRYGDGGGLYLEVARGGTKSWLFMWKVNGKRRALGLGGYPAVPLAGARTKAAKAKAEVADGRDPSTMQQQARSKPTFGQCVDDFMSVNSPSWRNLLFSPPESSVCNPSRKRLFCDRRGFWDFRDCIID